jgi:23S rRNA (cytidine1920-2'-O)/16S rRNA (cytidine1409-2'-O)-methyltransferase
LTTCATEDADFMLLVKPQFEVGRDGVEAGGVVRDPAKRAAAVRAVTDAALTLDLGTASVVASPLPGPAGNVEYFVHLRSGAPAPDPDEIQRVVEAGPQ